MKVLNFGSLNIDHVYRVEHFMQPGATQSSLGYARFPGGKGLNQSIALACAGARVYHAGCIGADGEFLRGLLAEKGVDTRFVRTAAQPTGHAVIQVDRRGQNCILLFGGANQCVDEAQIDAVLDGFAANDILLLQNEINALGSIMDKAYDRGMRIVLNPSPMEDALLALPLHKVWALDRKSVV